MKVTQWGIFALSAVALIAVGVTVVLTAHETDVDLGKTVHVVPTSPASGGRPDKGSDDATRSPTEHSPSSQPSDVFHPSHQPTQKQRPPQNRREPSSDGAQKATQKPHVVRPHDRGQDDDSDDDSDEHSDEHSDDDSDDDGYDEDADPGEMSEHDHDD